MTSRNFGQFLRPLPHRQAFYYLGLGTVLTTLFTQSFRYDRDVTYGRSLMRVEKELLNQNYSKLELPFTFQAPQK